MAGVGLTITRGGSFFTGLGAAAVTWASVIASAAWIRSSEIRATSRGRRRSSTFAYSAARPGSEGNVSLSIRKSASATSRLTLSTSARAENQTTPKCSSGDAALSTEKAARAWRRVPSHFSICGW